MFNLKIVRDEDAESPRTFDNLGIMVCFHNRYNLGDDHDLEIDHCRNWEAIEKHLVEEEGALHVLPLYLMDHSGLSMSVEPFSCPWDSGQIGFIYTTAKRIKEIGTPEDKIDAALYAEVAVYDKYINGDCWGFVIEDADEEHVDSCFGYYGREDAEREGDEVLATLVARAEAQGEPGMHRIVVCLDIEARSMEEAYRRVYRRMKRVDCESFQWESSDEWYKPDATPLTEDEAQTIRMAVYAEENPAEEKPTC